MKISKSAQKAIDASQATIAPIGSKPNKEAIDKAVAPTVKMVGGFTLEASGKKPYAVLQPSRKAFSAWTIAALVVCGKLSLSDKGTPTAKGVGNGLYPLLTSISMRGHWGTTTGRIDAKGALTVKGLAEIQARLTGASKGYDTDTDTVKAFINAMQKSGIVEVGTNKFKVSSAVSAKA